MKVIFLGTGTSQGVPVIGCKCSACISNDPKDKRFRCSIYVEKDNQKFVIDIGPDFRTQFLSNHLEHIDFALITHEHSDHTAGLDDIRPINFKSGKPLDIFAMPRVIDDIKSRFGYIFKSNPYPGAPRINAIPIKTDKLNILNGESIIPININHGDLPILGFRIGDFAYLTDVKTIPDAEMDKLNDVKVIAISALRQENHNTHLTLDESLKLIQDINPQKAYLIHMSHTLGPVAQWSKNLPNHVAVAYDGLIIDV